jgi:nucleoside-diphosphate-sugar epimerase
MIVVTGGLGFIGKRLVQNLKKKHDDEIIIVDKKN